jgi:hypothetical protein
VRLKKQWEGLKEQVVACSFLLSIFIRRIARCYGITVGESPLANLTLSSRVDSWRAISFVSSSAKAAQLELHMKSVAQHTIVRTLQLTAI